MRRIGVVLLAMVGILATTAGAVAAAPPVKDTVTRSATITDDGEACGFPVEWQVDLVGRRTRYYAADGRLVRAQIVIREDNTITNLDTGLTLREGPDAFVQRVDYGADGTVIVSTGGTSVNVRTDQGRVTDHGRFVVRYAPGEAPEVLHDTGLHLPRRLLLAGGETAALAAFCGPLSGEPG